MANRVRKFRLVRNAVLTLDYAPDYWVPAYNGYYWIPYSSSWDVTLYALSVDVYILL